MNLLRMDASSCCPHAFPLRGGPEAARLLPSQLPVPTAVHSWSMCLASLSSMFQHVHANGFCTGEATAIESQYSITVASLPRFPKKKKFVTSLQTSPLLKMSFVL